MLSATPHIIDDSTPVSKELSTNHARGLVPRDFTKNPLGSYPTCRALPTSTYPRDEWIPRIQEKIATKSTLQHIRRRSGPNGGPIPSLDQNGIGYCWCHSGTMGVMLTRAKMGLPYVRLSAFMVGCLIKNYSDQGGWGAQGLDFIAEHGVPSVDFWPEKSMKRSNDTPEMRQNALQHKAFEFWADLASPQYDRNMSEDQEVTCLINNDPLIGDFNWWSHSVILIALALANSGITSANAPKLGSLDFNNPAEFKVYADVVNKVGLNSWTDGWGDVGEFTLSGSKAKTDGAVAIGTTGATSV